MGGGVGHKATNAFTQAFAREAHNLSADPVDDPLEVEDGNQDDEEDDEDAGCVEEEDYGYVVSDSDGEEGHGGEDEEGEEDLGGEDGEEPWEMDDIQTEGFDDL